MAMNNVQASSTFEANEVWEMEELVRINEQLKKIEKRKKELVDKVKASMNKANVLSVSVAGKKLSITESVRRTVTAKTKDEFIAQLIGEGKKHLVSTEIIVDLDSVFAEVDAGTLDCDFVNKYVKITPVTTLRCD